VFGLSGRGGLRVIKHSVLNKTIKTIHFGQPPALKDRVVVRVLAQNLIIQGISVFRFPFSIFRFPLCT